MFNYCSPKKLREGNVFIGVCVILSTEEGGIGYPGEGVYPAPNHKSRRYTSYWNVFLLELALRFDHIDDKEVAN